MKIVDINGKERDCLSANIDPKWPGFVLVKYVSNRDKNKPREEWYPIEEFEIHNKELLKKLRKKGDIDPEEIETLGIVSSATKNLIRDKSKDWKKDIYKGFPIWISRGKGEGQVRKVVSNTKDTLTVDEDWDIVPNSSSQYVLSFNIHDVHVLGNTLPGYEK